MNTPPRIPRFTGRRGMADENVSTDKSVPGSSCTPDSDGGVIVARFPPTSVPAEIYATEPLGDSTILDLKVGDKLLKAVVAASFEGDVGAKIGVQFPSDRIHLFHRKSGQAIR